MKKVITVVLMVAMLLCACGSEMYTVKIKTDADGDVVKEFYNSENKQIKREYINAEGEMTAEMEYFYDEEGNLIKSGYGYEGYSQITEYAYDEKGNNVSVVMSDSDGYEASISYTYNDEGKKEKEVVIDPVGGNFTIAYTYDEGILIGKTQTSTDGNEMNIVYSYDENGNKVKEEISGPAGYSNVVEYTYDEKGNVITEKEISSFMNGLSAEEKMTIYTYDEDNNIIKEEYCDPDGKTRVEEYTYTEEKVKTVK